MYKRLCQEFINIPGSSVGAQLVPFAILKPFKVWGGHEPVSPRDPWVQPRISLGCGRPSCSAQEDEHAHLLTSETAKYRDTSKPLKGHLVSVLMALGAGKLGKYLYEM